MTQIEAISKYIDDFGSISPIEAFSDLGITKLATRISEMIRDGAKINKKVELKKTSYGKITHYKRKRVYLQQLKNDNS